MRYLVMIEGADNIGKTTCVNYLASYLEEHNPDMNVVTRHFGPPKSINLHDQYVEQKKHLISTIKSLRYYSPGVYLWDRSIFGELVYSIYRNYKIDYKPKLGELLNKIDPKKVKILFVVFYADDRTFEKHKIKPKPDAKVKYQDQALAVEISRQFIEVSKFVSQFKCVDVLVVNTNNYKSLEERNEYVRFVMTQWFSGKTYFPNSANTYVHIPYNISQNKWSSLGLSQKVTRCPDYNTCTLGKQHHTCEFGKKYRRPTSGFGSRILDDLKYIFVGEAPGRKGCGTLGIPFYGDRSGNLFQKTLRELKIHPMQVWTTNVVLCCPEDNKLGEFKNLEKRNTLWCTQNRLKYEITTITDHNKTCKVIAVGRVAESSLGALGVSCIFTYHPSYFLRIGKADGYRKHLELALGDKHV